MTPVQDGPSCPGCGLANYSGLCPVCSGDEVRARDEGLPYPWPDEHTPDCFWLRAQPSVDGDEGACCNCEQRMVDALDARGSS